MDYKTFMDKVGEQTKIEDESKVVMLVKATFETLSERIPRTHRDHLAAQLPEGIKEYLPINLRVETITLENFYRRVSNRADLGYGDAVKYTADVMWVLKLAAAEGELKDILLSFPEEYNQLFKMKVVV